MISALDVIWIFDTETSPNKDKMAVCICPSEGTDVAEHRLGLDLRHAEHLSQGEALGAAGEEEVLRHCDVLVSENTIPHTASLASTKYRI